MLGPVSAIKRQKCRIFRKIIHNRFIFIDFNISSRFKVNPFNDPIILIFAVMGRVTNSEPGVAIVKKF